MLRVLLAVCCACLLSGCAGGGGGGGGGWNWGSGWLSGLNFGTPAARQISAELRIESEPPGADARISTGPTCRTPCTLPVNSVGDFNVAFSLAGHLPQTVAVRVKPPGNPDLDPSASESAVFTPNPVFAELHPEPPPRGRRRPPPR